MKVRLELKCPYNRLELSLAGISLDSKCNDEEFLQALTKKMEEIFASADTDYASMCSSVAKDNGITTKELADSPNRDTMIAEGVLRMAHNKINQLVEWGLSAEEAWSIVNTAMEGI